jgi:hypothetical protein
MSYFQVVPGLYYAVSGGFTAGEWLKSDFDMAQPQGAPALAVADPKPVWERRPYGLIAYQSGLYVSQTVSEATWATRIPHEFQLRRREVDENGYAWPGERLSDAAFSRYNRELRFRLRVQYINYNVGAGFDFTTPRVIDIHATPEFREVTLDSMMAHNQPGDDASFATLDSVGASAIQGSIDHVPRMHPKYFHTISPNDDVSVTDPLKLGFRVSMKPTDGISRRALAEWFDPLLPREVNTNLASENGPRREQLIDYEF